MIIHQKVFRLSPPAARSTSLFLPPTCLYLLCYLVADYSNPCRQRSLLAARRQDEMSLERYRILSGCYEIHLSLRLSTAHSLFNDPFTVIFGTLLFTSVHTGRFLRQSPLYHRTLLLSSRLLPSTTPLVSIFPFRQQRPSRTQWVILQRSGGAAK